MATRKGINIVQKSVKKRTSIGRSVRSRPTSKNAKRQWKKYQGQG
jgi:hypothetical protein